MDGKQLMTVLGGYSLPFIFPCTPQYLFVCPPPPDGVNREEMVGQIQMEEDIERKREGTEEEVRDRGNDETEDSVMLHLEQISDQ